VHRHVQGGLDDELAFGEAEDEDDGEAEAAVDAEELALAASFSVVRFSA